MSEYHSKEVRRLEFERWTNKLNELERRVDYLDTKLRSKLDYLLKEIQKLRPEEACENKKTCGKKKCKKKCQ